MRSIAGKEIRKAKLTVTTECNLGCNYCFVKRSASHMPLDTARRAVDILLDSPGEDKLLSIYGGEPLVRFAMVARTIEYAMARAVRMKKRLTVSVCTNFVLCSKEHLEFFASHGVKLVISIAGSRVVHNQHRPLVSGGGSYDLVMKKLPLLWRYYSPVNAGVAFCVFPETARTVEKEIAHLMSLGFRHINFEIIRDFSRWGPDEAFTFLRHFERIGERLIAGISSSRSPLYLNPVNWELKCGALTDSLTVSCPFNYKLEVYPDGAMAFSPFVLNLAKSKRFVIGNVRNKELDRYCACTFDARTAMCGECERAYFREYRSDPVASRLYLLYHVLCVKFSQRLRDLSAKNGVFRAYVRRAANEVCF